MAYTEDEIKRLKDRIQSARLSGRLSDWELRYLSDLEVRIQKYGRNLRLSDSQVSKLYEILTSEPSSQPQHRSARPYERRPRRRSASIFPRKTRRYGRNTFRDAAFIAVLVVVGVAYAAFKEVAGSNLDGQHVAAAMPQYLTRSLSRSEFTVTDGDTIHIDGQSRGMRLVGLNAPETWQPQCPAEKALGERAKARLRQLVSSATLEVQRVPCSCPPGTEGTDSCNYGRSCGILRANGRDVGQVLIAEGLAVPFVCGVTRCPRTPRPWCG